MLLDESPPFDDPNFIFELKLDGFRAIAYLGESTTLISRNGNNLTLVFPELSELHQHVRPGPPSMKGVAPRSGDGGCILDGEIISVKNNKPVFPPTKKYFTQFIAFDILSLDGENLMQRSLLDRKKILSDAITASSRLVMSQFIHEHGTKLFELAAAQGLEGIVAKRAASIYRPGKRTTDWLKILNPDYRR